MNTPKVLILCYDFYPLNSAGSHRIKGWMKYLRNYGVHPVIVTRKWNNTIENPEDYDENENGEIQIEENSNHTLIRIPFKKSAFEKTTLFFRRKNLGVLSKAFTFLSFFVKYLPHINIEKTFYFKNIYNIIEKQKPDLILASGEPFILFKYAHQISKKTGIPYSLDYRDGWSTNFGKKEGLLKFVSKIESKFEKKYLKNKLFATTAAQIIKEEIITKFITENIYVIENGANLELIESITSDSSDNFEIVYTGTIYQSHNIEAFLQAFEEFITKKNPKAVVKFIGINFYDNKHKNLFDSYADQYPNNIMITSKVSHEKAIALQKSATVLLKFCSGPVTKGFYGAKLYEYASLNKPILTVAGIKEDAVTDFFKNEGIQRLVYDKYTCLKELIYLNDEFKAGRLENKNLLTEEQIQSISCERQVENLALLIRQELNNIRIRK